MAEDSLAYWNAAAVKAFGCTLAELQMRNMVGIETPALGEDPAYDAALAKAQHATAQRRLKRDYGIDFPPLPPINPDHEHTEQ